DNLPQGHDNHASGNDKHKSAESKLKTKPPVSIVVLNNSISAVFTPFLRGLGHTNKPTPPPRGGALKNPVLLLMRDRARKKLGRHHLSYALNDLDALLPRLDDWSNRLFYLFSDSFSWRR